MVFVAVFVDTFVFTIFTGEDAVPLLAPYHYATVDFINTNAPAMTQAPDGGVYYLGTDYLGRDNLSRTMYGARISLSVAIVAATVSLVVGLIYGLVAGFSRPSIDNGMMRFVDFLYGFPLIIFIILMQVYFKALSTTDDTGPIATALIELDQAMGGLFFVFVALGLINWLGMARHRPRPDALLQGEGVCRGGQIGRQFGSAYHLQAPAAQHRRHLHRLRDIGHSRLHPDRGVSLLHRPGRQPADTELGHDDLRDLRSAARGAVAVVCARNRTDHHNAGLQLPG